ncbi:MAG: hypothetical protein AAF542_00990 [Pseudomonadota bacterium]
MDAYNLAQAADFRHERATKGQLSAGAFAGIEILVLTTLGVATTYMLYGSFDWLHVMLSLFLSLNLLICFWEICLFLRRDYIEKRRDFWAERRTQTKVPVAIEYMSTGITLKNMFSPTFWADMWSTYALYDGSYADRRTYGFNADVGNGFTTLIPSIILHVGITVQFLPARVLGIVGVMMFWQWLYCTCVYWASFFVAGRHTLISKKEMKVYIWGTNGPWAFFSLFGLYASIRLVLDDNYSVLGM